MYMYVVCCNKYAQTQLVVGSPKWCPPHGFILWQGRGYGYYYDNPIQRCRKVMKSGGVGNIFYYDLGARPP